MTDAPPSLAKPAFFQRRDLLTFALTFLVSLVVYFYSLPPTVTLEDAGELAVAADYLGVPHPPGYPIWTFLAWFFQWILHVVQYNGHPNPAWAVAFMSAFFGALASGTIGMLISRSSRLLVENLHVGKSRLLAEAPAWGIGLGGGLLLGLLLHTAPGLGKPAFLLLVLAFVAIGCLRGLTQENDRADWIDKLPTLAQCGAVLYGMIFASLSYLAAWGWVTNPAVSLVLPFAAAITAVVAALVFATDFILGRAAARPHLGRDFAGAGVDVLAGIGGGLLLAFSPLMWSQSVIIEVYSLNAFFMAVLMLLIFWYICRPHDRLLYVTAFTFALGLTNHQSLLFVVFFLVAGIAAAGQKRLLKDGLFLMALGVGGLLLFKARQYFQEGDAAAGTYFVLRLGYVAGFIGLLVACKGGILTTWRKMLMLVVLGLLGVSFHLFMPFASEQNPPMNWGYARTMKGFKHALFRGQYAKFSVADNVKRVGNSFAIKPTEKMLADADPTDLAVIHGRRTFFLRQLAAFFYGPDSKYSIANQFSWQYPLGERDPTGKTPPPAEKNIPLALLGLIPLIAFTRLDAQSRGWFHSSLLGMFFITVVFMVIQWPELNHNDLFIKRVQYVQAHVVYAMWMAMGVVIALLALYALVPQRIPLTAGAAVLAVVFAWFPLDKNARDQRHLEFLGSSDLAGHDFGWQFGFYQLKGANGILLDELSHHKNPDCALTDWSKQYLKDRAFPAEALETALSLAKGETLPLKRFRREVAAKLPGLNDEQRRDLEHAGLLGAYRRLSTEEQAASLKFLHRPLPDLDYPPEMDQGAIFFGGTDPGRFVPTYMIFSAKVRPDVFLITQNALADPTYLDTMRDLYGDAILIPSAIDSNNAFREYGDNLRIFDPEAYMGMMGTGGRISVSGVGEVMQINFTLAREMFERNKWRHSFYIEESYMIPWMYAYLRPHGLIMKVDPTPSTLSPADIEKDFAFWTWYVEKLLETHLPPEDRSYVFQRDLVARKTFSKLRGAIAGLYFEKGLADRAEAAYLQSLELYPASPEAVFRLADMYNQQLRFDDAERVVERFAGFDPTNHQIPIFYQGLGQLRRLNETRIKAEASLATRPSANTALQLVQYYGHLQMDKEMEAMANLLLRMPNLHADFYQHLASFMRIKKNKEYYLKATEAWAKGSDTNPEPFYDLAAYHLSQNAYQDSFDAMIEAVRREPVEARRRLAADPRFAELRVWPQFQRLVTVQDSTANRFAPRASAPAPQATRGFNLPLGP